jgi:uncharacterized protein YkwD
MKKTTIVTHPKGAKKSSISSPHKTPHKTPIRKPSPGKHLSSDFKSKVHVSNTITDEEYLQIEARVKEFRQSHSPTVFSPYAGSEASEAHNDHEALEMEILAVMNRCRTKPQEFAELLKKMIPLFKGTIYNERAMTKEGAAVVEETIKYLKEHSPVGALSYSKGLTLAARDHVLDQGPTGDFGHNGTDGSDSIVRSARHGNFFKTMGENISYGPNTGLSIIIQLIVDDGVEGRGHRLNIMEDAYSTCGVGFGVHKLSHHMCVIDYAGKFINKGEQISLNQAGGLSPVFEGPLILPPQEETCIIRI